MSVILMSNARQGALSMRGWAIHSDVRANKAVLWHSVHYDGVKTQKGEKKKKRQRDRRSF